MTPAETRCVMALIVMPMHASGVAGGIRLPWPWIDRLRAAGRPERPS